MDGAREIGFAVIATTLVLVTVFLPMSFLQGNVGKLFREFGFTIAAAVLFSALVALTLTPMMTSKLFGAGAQRSRMSHAVERFFARLSTGYDRNLRRLMRRPWLVVGGTIAATALAAVLLRALPSELAPPEDRGFLFIGLNGPEGASLDYMDRHARMAEAIARQEVATGDAIRINLRLPGAFGGATDMSQGRGFVLLAPWDERERSAEQIAQSMRVQLNQIPGVRASITVPSGWSVGMGSPVQVVLGGTEYADLVQWRDLLMERMQQNPGLTNVQSNYEERKPQLRVAVDRNRAADLGVSLAVRGAHAGDGARFAHRDDVRRSRPRIQRDPAGAGRGSRDAHRPRQPLRALGPHAAARAAVEPRAADRARRADAPQPVRPAAVDHDQRGAHARATRSARRSIRSRRSWRPRCRRR